MINVILIRTYYIFPILYFSKECVQEVFYIYMRKNRNVGDDGDGNIIIERAVSEQRHDNNTMLDNNQSPGLP